VKTGFRSMRLADGAPPTPSSAPRLSPFRNLHGLTGVFLGGALPHWILREDATPVQMYSIDEQDVRAFAPSSFYGQSEEYILATGDGTHLVAVPPSISFNQPLPAKRVPTSRTYSHLVFDPPSRHLVAAGVFAIPFVIFDEDDNRIQVKQPDPKVLPLNERSSLELLDYDTCEIIDGYEFADNEVVLALASVNLQTKRTPLGFKDYIAVGTGISRGEDLSERGAVSARHPCE
jgi:cleavage and polyadenylation specificity factor subunit 1